MSSVINNELCSYSTLNINSLQHVVCVLLTVFDVILYQVYGAAYLQKLLEPLLRGVITTPEHISFEVDPTRLVPASQL